jgi:alanyl aminopeptidase
VAVLAPVAAAAADERLGTDVVPTAEAIRLVLDPARADYTGSVRVDLEVRRAAPSFAFHAEDMTLERVALRGAAGEVALKVAAAGAHGLQRATPDTPLAPGRYALDIDFKNDFNTRATSLYRLQTGGDWYAFTQFEAVDARGAFPCWDEPAFKIPFQVTLVVPHRHLAVSNSPVESLSVEGAAATVVFKPTPPLPAYLLAIATGPLEAVPIPGMSVPGRVVTVKGASALAAEAARVTPKLVAGLEAYFGRPYPFAKLDLLAVPEFWPGAMENAGAVTFADSVLLVDPRAASVAQRRTLIEFTAHELAHMWFGDLVTMAWWDDLWLNESFASWMEEKVAQEAYPELHLDVGAVQSVQRALSTDARNASRAIRAPVDSVDNLLQSADELTYEKGRAVLGMIEAWVGPEAFQRGVRDYLAAHEWKNATAADLWTALSTAAHRDVRGPMESFLDQPGVPIVSAELIEGGRAVRLTQSRFANAGATPPTPTLWRVPVTLKYTDGDATRTTTVLLGARAQDVKLRADNLPVVWIHPNASERGYYRWKVAPVLLRTTAENATRRLDARERVGFVGNLSALLDGGLVSGADYLRALAHFGRDPEPDVVQAVLGALAKVRRAFVTDDVRGPFASYVRRTLGPALDRIGLSRREGEPEGDTALRSGLLLWLGRDGGDPRIAPMAASLAHSYLDDPSAVDPSVASVSLGLAARSGDRALFEELRKRFETTKVPAERSRYLSALGEFREPALVDEALAYALSGPLRPQEVPAIPRSIIASGEDGGRAFRWLRQNYEAVAGRIPPMYAPFMAPMALGGACSAERIQAARTFFAEPGHQGPGTAAQLAKATETAEDCVRLRAREGASVTAYLRALDPR